MDNSNIKALQDSILDEELNQLLTARAWVLAQERILQGAIKTFDDQDPSFFENFDLQSLVADAFEECLRRYMNSH